MANPLSAVERLDAIDTKASQLSALLNSIYGTGLDHFLEIGRDGQDRLLWLASDLAEDIGNLVSGGLPQTAEPGVWNAVAIGLPADVAEKFPAHSANPDMLKESVGLVDSASGLLAIASESHANLDVLFAAIADATPKEASVHKLARMGQRMCNEHANDFECYSEDYGNHATKYMTELATGGRNA